MPQHRGRARRDTRLPLWVVVPWLVTATILLAAGALAFWPGDAELRDPKTPGRTGALVWGEGVFSSAAELQAWLKARGVSYKAWARKHPEAVDLLIGEPGTGRAQKTRPKASAAGARNAKPATKAPAPAARKAKLPPPPTGREVSPTARTLATSEGGNGWFFVALLALLMSVGAALTVSVSRFGAPPRAAGVGLGLLLTAMSIGVGLATAALLS